MRAPSPLKLGDTIGFTATARFLPKEELIRAASFFEKHGFKVVFSEHCSQAFHQFGGNDVARAQDFQDLLENPEVRAIFSVRGGYGTVRMMDKVHFDPLELDPKWICGYSDISILHGRMQQLGMQSLHSSMPVNFHSLSSAAFQRTIDVLLGKRDSFRWDDTHSLKKVGEAEGNLVGGNLSVLYSAMASNAFPPVHGNILFIEDLDEYLYHIDRMMRALVRSNLLLGIKGLIIGGMTDMRDHDIPFGWNAEEIISDAFAPMSIPIAFGFPSGHMNDNHPIVLGANVRLKVGAKRNEMEYVIDG